MRALFLVVLVVLPALAVGDQCLDTFYVSEKNGFLSRDCGTQQYPCQRPQDAIDKAVACEAGPKPRIVQLAPEVYENQLLVIQNTKNFVLRGGDFPASESAQLRNNFTNPLAVLLVRDVVDFKLMNIVIGNNERDEWLYFDDEGGDYIPWGTRDRLPRVTSGGVDIRNSTATLANCLFETNYPRGVTFNFTKSYTSANPPLVVSRCAFIDNGEQDHDDDDNRHDPCSYYKDVSHGCFDGAGLNANATEIKIEHSYFLRNRASYVGGAVRADAKLSVFNTTFRFNRARRNGKAIYQPISAVNDTMIRKSLFHDHYGSGGRNLFMISIEKDARLRSGYRDDDEDDDSPVSHESTRKLTIDDTTLYSDDDSDDYEILQINGRRNTPMNLAINKSEFTVYSQGRALVVRHTDVAVTHSNFEANRYRTHGSWFAAKSNVTISNSTIEGAEVVCEFSSYKTHNTEFVDTAMVNVGCQGSFWNLSPCQHNCDVCKSNTCWTNSESDCICYNG